MEPAIALVKNQYYGVNAHLNSFLQAQGNGREWETFHDDHISDLRVELNRQLRAAGYTQYYAKPTQGIQIKRLGEPPRYPEPDGIVLDKQPGQPLPNLPYLPQAIPGLQVLTVQAALADVSYFKAVAIYSGDDKPVAWIEILSPSNKPGGSQQRTYLEKRDTLLEAAEFSFIEIDYLHKSSPTIAQVPDYTRQENGAAAYRVAVLDPRYGLHEGPAYIIPFNVDQPIPAMLIPLGGADILHFDLGAAYNLTFERVQYGINPDTRFSYAELPLEFETYTPADQQAIRQRIKTVIQAFHQGVDLEKISSPLPAPQE